VRGEARPDKYLPLIVCQTRMRARSIPTGRNAPAETGGRRDSARDLHQRRRRAAAAHRPSFAESQQKGAQGSPTMFLNGKPYEGGRKSRDFLKAACQATTGEQPQACKDIPVPPVVHAIFFSDKRCRRVQHRAARAAHQERARRLQARHVDYMTDEGKALYRELQGLDASFKLLPTIPGRCRRGRQGRRGQRGAAGLHEAARQVQDPATGRQVRSHRRDL